MVKVPKKSLSSLWTRVLFRILNWDIRRKYITKEIKDQQEMEELFALRYKVYCEECNYLDPKNYPAQRETDSFDAFAKQFGVVSKNDKKIVGTVRLIPDNEKGFPLESDFKIHKINGGSKTVEVSRLAIEKRHRKGVTKTHAVLLALLRQLYKYCRANNYDYLVAAIDQNVFEMLKRFGFSFQVLGESKYYMGSESIPVLVNLNHEVEWLKIVNPPLWGFLNKPTEKE